MLNILANERLKLIRNILLPVCTLIALILPVFMVVVDFMEKDAITTTMLGIGWLRRSIIPIQIIAYPVLSGFVITFLIQKEYAERTMINTLTAPTNRAKFTWEIYCLDAMVCYNHVRLFSYHLRRLFSYIWIWRTPIFH